ncbi:Homoserine O-succinyltransferase [[Eubacterium] infirmum]|nr:Homoserine O-succinyltransferase [[Eubacterium] infirmum]
MPIRVPNNLPAVETLTNENVFVMTDSRAITQDIRPLQILILNLMPTKIDTETQLTRLLGNSPLQVELELLQTASHKSQNTPEEHMLAFYKSFEQVKQNYYDGMIVTGAPVELMEFEEVEYWDELCEIMEWSKSHVHSTFYICWGAQAGLYYHYGIKKHVLAEKLSGVYKHHLRYKTGMLFRGFDDIFYVPHSRNTDVDVEAVEACKDIKVVAESDEAGIFAIKSNDDKQIFIMGHSEYDADTLKKEYERDVKQGKNPNVPCNYYPDDDPGKEPQVVWRSCANLLFSNWLNYFVYQSTPYDINSIQQEASKAINLEKSDLTVSKFGGTSLAGADRFRAAKEIIEADKNRKFVVVSAPGKRDARDNKVTDLLVELADSACVGGGINLDIDHARNLLSEIKERFVEIEAELRTGVDVDAEFTKIEHDIFENGQGRAYITSRGEYMNGILMAAYLGEPWQFVDAKDIVFFDNDGKLLLKETIKAISDRCAKLPRAVIPGFYGSLAEDGSIETFSRGGSDISASLVAAALHADLYENWTDVSGILMADPGIVRNPVTVPVMTYKELRELSYLGATVMHPDVVEPVVKLGIPIIIKNTMNPDATGTLVVKDKKYYKESMEIAGISGKRGFVVIKLEKTGLNDDTKLRQSILDFFTENSVNITNIIAGIDSLILLVPKDNFEKTNLSFFEMEANIRKMAGGIKIDITKDIAVIGVVGRELGSSPTVVIKTLSALAGRRIDVKLIDHGQGQISILIAVAATDYAEAIRSIYGRFV